MNDLTLTECRLNIRKLLKDAGDAERSGDLKAEWQLLSQIASQAERGQYRINDLIFAKGRR